MDRIQGLLGICFQCKQEIELVPNPKQESDEGLLGERGKYKLIDHPLKFEGVGTVGACLGSGAIPHKLIKPN